MSFLCFLKINESLYEDIEKSNKLIIQTNILTYFAPFFKI